MAKISIIITTWNSEETIINAIESAINQEYEDLEIIIIDDGSVDNTEKKVTEFIKKYENIKYYKKENTGVSDTRNFGIRKATGDYILFLDDDDYLEKDLLKRLKPYILKGNSLVKYKLRKIDEKGNLLENIDGPVFENLSGEEGFNELYSEDILIDSPCIYLIKKDIFIKNKYEFMKNTEHEDFGLMPLIIISAPKMSSINFYGYNYIQVRNSIVRGNKYDKIIKRAYDTLIHYDNMCNIIENLEISKKTKENIKIYYTNVIILKILELEKKDKKQFIKELKKRKMFKNIKVRNFKQLVKKILLNIDVNLYLKLR